MRWSRSASIEEASPEFPGANGRSRFDVQPAGQDRAPDAGLQGGPRAFHRRQSRESDSRNTGDWRGKIERVGTLNYPAEARGKLYGMLRLTVTIRPDGSVDSIDLDRSSGLKVLDRAAFRIVQMAAPFAVFPADIRKDTDLLVITRTWFFAQGDKVWTE